MNFDAERSLALMAADDGDLLDAEQSLTALIERAEQGLGGEPPNADALYQVCRCLLDRANVRSWAVRPVDALGDLDRAEPLLDRLKQINRRTLRVGLLDTRARLRAAPFSPVYDASMAQETLARLRSEIWSQADSWMADIVELRLAQHVRNWPRAVELAQSALARLQQLGATRGVQAVQLQLARSWLELDRPEQATNLAEAAHTFFASEGPPDLAAHAAIALARVRGPTAGWPLAETALAQVEQLTRAQRSLFDQQRYLVEKLQVYDDAFGLALAGVTASTTHEAREQATMCAWRVAERAKSFSLRQAMMQGGWLAAIDPESANELADLERQLEAAEARADRSEDSARLQADLADRRQRVLQTAMRRNPLLARAHAPPELDLKGVLDALPTGVGVVSWYWLTRPENCQLHIFHAGADRRPLYCMTEFTHDEVAALDPARWRPVTSMAQLRLTSMLPASLADKVFPPGVLQSVAACHTLLLTPHRYLRQLPLHIAEVTAPTPKGHSSGMLIERFAVEVLPTLALPFPVLPARDAARRVLLMGCRQDGFHSPELAEVPLELETLAELWRERGHAVEEHLMSTSARLAQHVPPARWLEFDVIHLACHGRFIAGSPLDASLYLGGEALRASEFFQLKLQCDVVCLSACDVGQQSEMLDGLKLVSDEWLGLALPLFQAGTRSLLVSLWEANSAVAQVFMQDFHAALAQGLDPARAHQQACLAQIRRGKPRPLGFWSNWQLAGFPIPATAAGRNICKPKEQP